MMAGRWVYRSPWLIAVKQRWSLSRAPAFARLSERSMVVWRERPDLRAAFDISTASGRCGLFWWCLLHGFREMGFEFDARCDAECQIVNQPLPALKQRGFTPVTWLMRALCADAVQCKGDLNQADVQANYLAHYFSHMLLKANLGSFLTENQGRLLREVNPIHGAPRLCELIWQCDPKLGDRFRSFHDPAFVSWCSGDGARVWPILAHPLVALAPVPKRKLRQGPLRGVNLFGHPSGRLGVGEDIRMAARSLEAVGIPYVICDVDENPSAAEEVVDGLNIGYHSPYDVNLFCMTALSTLATCIREGSDIHEGRHSIGLWPWELPEWPRALDTAWACIDEAWAASQFTYQAYIRAARVPVSHMPMAVVVDETEGCSRADFDLPEDTFLFGFSFDGQSSFARKNPEAVLRAFQQAFPPSDDRIALVLKGIRVEGDPGWQSLMDAIGDDARIHVISSSMSRGKLLDLYRALDAFVSLHRSEGFGRNIAEAMLLGKPTIVSSYSGSMDFARRETSALVPVRLCTVQPGEYPFGTGQLWADPDVDVAAILMRRFVSEEAWRRTIAAAGQNFIAQNYSPAIVGSIWEKRLQKLVQG